MKIVTVTRSLPSSHPDSLVDSECPIPAPSGRDVLVRVEAVSVNPVDTKVRVAHRSEAEPRVLGWDAAGHVEAVGNAVTLFRPGDAVYYAGDITRPGSNAQYQLVDERIVAHKPSTLDWEDAAAWPLVGITAYEALFERLRIPLGEAGSGRRLLIIGAGGGVGSAAIQLAKLAGLTVAATASRPASAAWVRQLGADVVVDHRQALRPQLEDAGIQAVDYILNCVDTDAYWDTMADLIAPQGSLCTIVDHKHPLNHAALKTKSVTHAWEFMFTRAKFRTPDMIEQHRLLTRLAAWIDEGRLQPIVHVRKRPICAASLREAHAMLETGTMIGKLVLSGW
ncbi:MAG: zinc-binding alcohol dehydrogenase family protein [Nitrospiraceae bacterium]